MAASCPGIPGVSQICGAVGGVASHVVGFGADQVLNSIGAWVVGGATWLLGQVGDAMTATSAPQLGAAWFTNHFRTMTSVAAVVIVPMLLVSIMRAVVRQDLSVLIRSALVHLPLALLFSAVAIEVVQLSISATDALSSTVTGSSGTDLKSFLTSVSVSLGGQGSGPVAPVFVTFLGGLVVAFGAFVLWLELIIRAASIYVAVLFLPLALAALVWPATSHWCRRLAETLAALILSKFVIVAVMSLAVGAMSGEGGPSGFTGVLAGAALLILATLSPYALLKIIPAVEAGAVSHLEGLSRRAARTTSSVTTSAASVALGAVGPALLPANAAADVPMATGLPEKVAHQRMAAAAAARSKGDAGSSDPPPGDPVSFRVGDDGGGMAGAPGVEGTTDDSGRRATSPGSLGLLTAPLSHSGEDLSPPSLGTGPTAGDRALGRGGDAGGSDGGGD